MSGLQREAPEVALLDNLRPECPLLVSSNRQGEPDVGSHCANGMS